MTNTRDRALPGGEPQRLLEAEPAIGNALRAYSERTRFRFGEARAWEALQLRRKRGTPRRTGLAAAAVLTAVALFCVWGLHSRPRAATSTPISAEELHAAPKSVSAPALSRNEARPAPASAATSAPVTKKPPVHADTAPAVRARTEASANSTESTAVLSAPTPDSAIPPASSLGGVNAPPSPVVQTPASEPQGHPDPCIAEQRAGRYEAALRCFQSVAAGNGVGAELALYEQARLESAVLGRPADALRTLDDHLRRFPAGALASEARLMKLGLLAQTGDGRALAEVERALAGPLGNERRGDLLFLRGNILRAQRRCAEARASYEQAERAGISHVRVERATRTCDEGQ